MRLRSVLSLLALAVLTAPTAAHEVPRDIHDRVITVKLERGKDADQAILRADYRLEVAEWTVTNKDLVPYADEIDAFDYRGRHLELYNRFAQRLGPDLAFRLFAKVNGKRCDLKIKSDETRAQLHEDNTERTPLGHLRCSFVFEASFPIRTDKDNDLLFEDQTYLREDGKIDLTLTRGAGLAFRKETVPSESLRKRAPNEREPGDDAKLRELRVTFVAADTEAASLPDSSAEPTPPAPEHDDHVLLRLFLHTDYGFWLTMLMAMVFGAAHALTPGHGKTLVAAYLVGERGTVWHAGVLGVVTTLTHTGIVLLIAAILFCLPRDSQESFGRLVQNGLGLAMGLLVVCMGFWLLLQRLSGRADHFHVGGGHHHPHHQKSEVGSQESGTDGGSVRWWGLIVLGITGGLVPCWDAIYLLLWTVGRSQFFVALPAVLAFSAGLAGVLVLIGVLVVQVPKFARSRWGNGTLVRALPIASAVVVTLMGLWLCYEGVHGR
jgi:ABC-type nickel/cobalt efflux system permease component RcnA